MATPRKKPEDLLKRGRPTKYDPKYCDEIIAFFSAEPSYEREAGLRIERVANRLPFFSAFARKIGVDDDTLENWADIHPDFFGAYMQAKKLQKEFLVENALTGLYNPAFAIFTAKNITDMRDKQEIEHSGSAGFILNVSEVGSRNQEPRADLQAD